MPILHTNNSRTFPRSQPHLGGSGDAKERESEKEVHWEHSGGRAAFALTHSENTIILLPLGCEIVRPLLNTPPS